MDEEERELLDEMRNDVREVRTNVEVLTEQVDNIDSKTDRIDERVFGRDGIEESVQKNSEQISRIQAIAAIVSGAITTVVAKIFNFV